MTPTQFAELYAMNLFNQEQIQLARDGEQTQTWAELTKKERDAYRRTAKKLLGEVE